MAHQDPRINRWAAHLRGNRKKKNTGAQGTKLPKDRKKNETSEMKLVWDHLSTTLVAHPVPDPDAVSVLYCLFDHFYAFVAFVLLPVGRLDHDFRAIQQEIENMRRLLAGTWGEA